jgi:DNA-binding PadR family transcriptional regulator
MKPKLKKGMNIFIGHKVGDWCCGIPIASTSPQLIELQGLADKGYLQSQDEISRRRWFALTDKGKTHVAQLEQYYGGIW